MLDWLGVDTAQYNHWEWVLLTTLKPWQWLVFALVSVGFAYLFWRNLKRLSSRRAKIGLYLLRWLAWLSLFLLFLQPAISLQKVVRLKTHLAVLVDRSRSMSLPLSSTQRRQDAAKSLFADHPDLWNGLTSKHTVHVYGFGESLQPLSWNGLTSLPEAKETRTNLAAAVNQTLDELGNEGLRGMVLVSDGMENPTPGRRVRLDDVQQRLQSAGIPVVAFLPDADQVLSDLAITDVHYDNFAFVQNKAMIEVVLKSRGLPESPVTVSLTRDGQPVTMKEVVPKRDEETSVMLEFIPSRVGRFVYTVDVPVPQGDVVPQNNQRHVIIQVVRDKIRVLHVTGHPDYDLQFMRRLLKRNPSVDLISFFILRTGNDFTGAPENELALIHFPTEQLFQDELNTFDLVVFQNFTYRGYQMEQYLPNIRRFVQQGGAVIITGGDVSYGMGGWQGTPVEEIMPFRIVAGRPEYDEQAFVMQVTAEGLNHPVTALAPNAEATKQLWDHQPALLGINLGLVPRPDALVLAVHPRLTSYGKPAPVAAVREVGKGRVLALATDATWVWNFPGVGQGNHAETYRAFWNNAIRWLIRDPQLQHLKLTTDKDRYQPGETIQLRVGMTDLHYQPMADAGLRVQLRRKGHKGWEPSEEGRTDAAGQAMFRLKAPDEDGLWELIVSASGSKGQTEQGEALVFVEQDSQELRQTAVAWTTMKGFTEATKGALYSMNDVPETLPFPDGETRSIGNRRDVPIWDQSLTLAMLVLVLGLEWWWRRRVRLS